MSLLRLLRLALKAIARNGFRTILTMLGIIIGVGAVITMLAIGEGARKNISDSIASMGSNMLFIRSGPDARGSVRRAAGETLTKEDVEALRERSSYLAAISPSSNTGGQAKAGSLNWPTSIYGVDSSYLTIRNLTVTSGRGFIQREAERGAKVCLVGQTVVDNLFDGADPVGERIRFKNIPLEVIGVLEEKGENSFGHDQDDVILAPFTMVQKRIKAVQHVDRIYASSISEDVTQEAIAEVSEILRESHRLRENQDDDFHVRSQQELGNTMDSTSRMLTVLLSAIAGISLLVGGIGIMNIMYVSVTERTREIGLRMAVGARGKDILMQFLIEAILISVTGGIVGMLLGVGTTFIVKNTAGWPTIIQPWTIVLSFAVCVVTGVFFGWYPALKASRLDPIEALRFE